MLGNIQVIANPQPGTSNQPYPIPPLPAFTAVQFEITADEHEAFEINIHTEIVYLWYNTIHASIVQLTGDLGDIATELQAISKALSKIEIAIGSLALARQQQTVILAAKASNQIKTNNFMMAASPDKPVMPSIKDQTILTISEASVLQGAAVAQGAILSFAGNSINAMTGWVKDTETYKTVTNWIKGRIEAISSAVSSSVKSIMRGTSAAAGDPTPK